MQNATYTVDADGIAAYKLPPVKAPAAGGRGVAPPRRFIDAPPPESYSSSYSAALPPPNIGPAPWLDRATPGAAAAGGFPSEAATYADDGDAASAAQASGAARARARGNVKAAAPEALPPIARRAEGAPASDAAGSRSAQRSRGAGATADSSGRTQPELLLASRARDRIRDRRTARAAQEAPHA